MKKILFLGRYFYPPIGGGEFFHLKILKELSANGHEVLGACYSDANDRSFQSNKTIDWQGIKVVQLTISDSFIEDFLKSEKPDIVLTHSFDALRIIRASKEIGAKTIAGVHFWRNICDTKDNFNSMLSRPLDSLTLLPEKSKCYTECDSLYVNSEFMRLALKRYTGIDCNNVVHPIIDIDRVFSNEKEPEYITLVNADEGKGGDFFCLLAERLKSLKFLCVGLGNDFSLKNKAINLKMKKIPNIKIIEKTDDIREVYKKTKILLIPSKVDETFSMVALEAMFNGIPIIASDNGNLPFLIGESGFSFPLEISLWENAINALNEDEEFYCKIAEKSLKESKKYLPEIEMNKFMKLITDVLGKN